jgi:hypothetical protein
MLNLLLNRWFLERLNISIKVIAVVIPAQAMKAHRRAGA